jgi:ParB/RepB/Spo0J family partition protein
MSDQTFQLPIHNISTSSKQTYRKIPLKDLPPNEELLSPPPVRELIESIAIRGQQTPIQLTINPDTQAYVVISGRRRIKALRAIELATPESAIHTVNAIIVSDIDEITALNMSAVENNLRNDNPLTDLEAIMSLKERNPKISESEISRQTGIPSARVKKRLKLNNIIPPLFQELMCGHINVTVAESIAKLSPAKQNDLINVYVTRGKITNDDVIAVQRAVVAQSASMLPSFPEIEPDQEYGYVLILKDETCTERLCIEEVHNLINNGIEYECVCKLVKYNL